MLTGVSKLWVICSFLLVKYQTHGVNPWALFISPPIVDACEKYRWSGSTSSSAWASGDKTCSPLCTDLHELTKLTNMLFYWFLHAQDLTDYQQQLTIFMYIVFHIVLKHQIISPLLSRLKISLELCTASFPYFADTLYCFFVLVLWLCSYSF